MSVADVSSQYRDAWEGFWHGASDTPGEVIWDADPSLSAAPHLELLEPYVDGSLPIVDLGCGNGTQTRYLATRYPRAVGVDLSAAAVARARRADPDRTAEFQQLNLTDPAGVAALHQRLGDVNVYLRAVIHQSDPADRPRVARAVAELIGRRGRAFVAEPTEEAREILAALAESPGGPPPKLERVIAHGLKPGAASASEVPEVLGAAGLTAHAHGQITLPMTEYRPDGGRVELPARWFVLSRGE